MLNKILVPVDFAPRSRTAAALAGFLAERLDASLDLLHVWETVPPLRGTDSGCVHTRAEAARRMKLFVRSLEGQIHTPFGARIEPGEVSESILRIAERGNYDLIVMGTDDGAGLAHRLLGGLTERVLRRACCPVLAVHGDGPERVRLPAPPALRLEIRP